MKKQIFFGTIGIVAIAATAIVTVSSVNANNATSDLMIKNLEALSQGEVVYLPCTTHTYEDCRITAVSDDGKVRVYTVPEMRNT